LLVPYKMNYIKQLDGIRAIAVILVIVWHWVPRNSVIENLHLGAFGVNIFFVLSGFLITRILLFNRRRAETSASSKTKLLKNFYTRRMLRIFPVYYLTIVLAIIFNQWLSLGVTKNEIFSNLTYTSNFFIYSTKAWPVSSLHFWSLAVEEQFYLAWPLIVLFWPKKYLLQVFLISIAAGFGSQLLITDYEFGNVPTITCLDCFGAGGLLAFITLYHHNFLKRANQLLAMLTLGAVVVLLISWQFGLYIPCLRFIHSIISCFIICHILLYRNKKSALITMLNNRLLIKIGKVSYGIYLYHMLYVYLASSLWYQYVFDHYSRFINKAFEPWIFLSINFWVLYFVARLSWSFIEKPLLGFKPKYKFETAQREIMVKLSEAS
jgi:peptidoglycan/LPS O-acetylase OafA/YrhL